jgi:hypothetical protein
MSAIYWIAGIKTQLLLVYILNAMHKQQKFVLH